MFSDPQQLKLLPRLMRSGILPGMSYEQRRKIIVVNIAGFVSGTCSMVFLISNIFTHYYTLCWLDLIAGCTGYSMILFNRLGMIRYPAPLAVLIYTMCCSYSAFAYHNNTHYFLLLFMGVSFIIWDNRLLATSLAVMEAGLFFSLETLALPPATTAVPVWNKGIVLLIALGFYIYFLHYFKSKSRVYQQTIEDQNHHLLELNLQKEKMLSVLAHDIHSPIANVYASLRMLKDDTLSPFEFNTMTDGLLRQVSNLQLNIKELLEWSKNQMSSPKPQTVTFQLPTVINSVLDFLRFQYEAKNIQIDTLGLENLTVYADPVHTEIMVRNLLNNAIKFSYGGGIIFITAALTVGMVQIEIRDSGSGIPDELLSQLFDGDAMISTYGTENEKGNGLGLKLCREFARLNGGDLWLASNLTDGITSTILLPASHGPVMTGS